MSAGMSTSLSMRATRIALAALGLLSCASFAHAQGFIPPPAPWLERPATPTTIAPPTTLPPGVPPHAPPPPPPPTPPGAPTPQPEAAPPVLLHREVEEAEAADLPRFGASFTYAQRNEHVDIVTPGTPGPLVGRTDVSVYAGRLDAFAFRCALGEAVNCAPKAGDPNPRISLNLAMLAGYADGSTEIGEHRHGMNGPVLGTATLLTLSGKPKSFDLWSKPRIVVPFVMAGFDYAATDFSTLDEWIHTFDVKPRAGVTLFIFDGAALSLYGGGSWEHFTEDQTSSGVTSQVRSQEPWAGLLGANYRTGPGPLEHFAFTAEGELGDRTGVVLMVRYEFDVPR